MSAALFRTINSRTSSHIDLVSLCTQDFATRQDSTDDVAQTLIGRTTILIKSLDQRDLPAIDAPVPFEQAIQDSAYVPSTSIMSFGRMFPSFNMKPMARSQDTAPSTSRSATTRSPPSRPRPGFGGKGVIGAGKVGMGGKGLGKGGAKRHR